MEAIVAADSPLAAHQAGLEDLIRISANPSAEGISHVIALENLPLAVKQQLAGSDGALVKILPSEQGVDVLQLFEEISCSINTTAAGGNASLMAMAD